MSSVTRTKKFIFFGLIFLGLANSALVSAGTLPNQSRELVFIETSAFEIGIDNDPLWGWTKDESIEAVEFTTQTPKNYYPPAVVNVRYHKNISAKASELRDVAKAAIKQAEENFSLNNSTVDSMTKVSYRSLRGYEVTFRSKVSGEVQDIKLLIAKSPKGNMLSMMVLTLPDKLPHVQPAVNRIFNNINFK